MTGIISITAKLLAIVDGILEAFVSVEMAYLSAGTGVCNIPVAAATVNDCGDALVDNIALLVYYLTYLGGNFFAALGVATVA